MRSFFVGILKLGIKLALRSGHSVGDAGVTVTIVRASKVGVKVGMVGRGVMDTVSVAAGWVIRVDVGSRDGVAVELSMTETFVGVGGAALIAGAVIFLTAPSSPPPAPSKSGKSVRLTPSFGAVNGLFVTGTY